MIEDNVPIEMQQKLLDIMLDNPTLVKSGDNTYQIRGLRKYSALKIADVYLKCKRTEKDTESILEECSTNLRYQAEIVAIILLNHTFTDDENDNCNRIKQMAIKVLLESKAEDEWSGIVAQAVLSLNVSDVFYSTELMKPIMATLRKRKEMTEQSLSTLQQK